MSGLKEVLAQWELQHGLTLDWATYEVVARRSISDYAAFGPGGIKAKGMLGYDATNLTSKATMQIIPDAVVGYLLHDVSPEMLIGQCDDLSKFIDFFRCRSGYHIEGEGGRDYGRLARWYISTAGEHLDKVREDGARTQLVEAGARVVNVLPPFTPDDIDRAWYLAKAEKVIRSITDPEVRRDRTIKIADLSLEQREQLELAVNTVEPDLERCRAIRLHGYRRDYANLGRGNRYSTMLALIPRIWMDQGGTISKGDLAWITGQIVEDDGYWQDPAKLKSLLRMVDWVCSEISPFALPATPEENARRALVWARENVAPNLRVRPNLHHSNAMDSSYVNREAIGRYRKTNNLYRLMCHIAAVMQKNHRPMEVGFLLFVVGDVQHHLAVLHGDDRAEASLSPYERAQRRVREQQRMLAHKR